MLKIGYNEDNLKILQENLDEIKMVRYIWGDKIVAYWKGDKEFEKPLWLAGFKGMEGTTALRRVQSILGKKFLKPKDELGLLVNKKEFQSCWIASHLEKEWDWRQGYVEKERYNVCIEFKDGSIFNNGDNLSEDVAERFCKPFTDFEEKHRGKSI